MTLTPGVNAPLIRGGTPVCSYQCGAYRAMLFKNPESFGEMKYPHVLVVFRVIDDSPPIMFVTAEQNLMANELLASLPEHLRPKVSGNPNSRVFLGVFDETGHENFGHSEECAILEKFETKALSIMKERLGLTASIEILNDTRRGDRFTNRTTSSASTDARISWGSTIGAALVSVVLFFALLYIVAPIAESLLNLHGRLFVPERYGGGSEVANPGILTLAFRAILASALSGLGALMAAEKFFSAAHMRTVAAIFSVVVIAWAGSFAYVGLASGAVLMPLVMVGLGATPPLVVAYWVWRENL